MQPPNQADPQQIAEEMLQKNQKENLVQENRKDLSSSSLENQVKEQGVGSSPTKNLGKNNQTAASSSSPETEDEEQQKLFVVEAHHDTEEVIERLLDVKGLEQSVSGLWGWMSGGVTKVAEKASQVA